MEIKEMPLEEKYDKVIDSLLLTYATSYALFKELGVEDKFLDLSVEVQKKMLPSFMGTAFKFMKAISPGRAFRQVSDQHVYIMQSMVPLSNIELTRVSDREAVVRVKDCPILKRMRDLAKKAGLDIDPRFMCEIDAKMMPEMVKEFGIDMTMELEENGCITTAKLK